uniref:Basic leucine zipper domain-containing protein n=1 Tax=Globisporangium ultimum (strain ATCC 200006 / CBS 805.95 / DAOM BR144) TaxID=431595 RepID=K3X0E0_GLOUD
MSVPKGRGRRARSASNEGVMLLMEGPKATGAGDGSPSGSSKSSTSTTSQTDGEPTADDKVLRRRLQYKMHQRRHRAKQKQKIETLEHEVSELRADISNLQLQSLALQQQNVFMTRGMITGAPAKIVQQYFAMYENGFSPRRYNDQEQFVQCVMSSSIEGPDYVGVETIKEQWRLYGVFFASTRYETRSYEITTLDDLTIVVVDADIHIRPRRDGVTALCPNLLGNEELIQEVVGSPIIISGKYRFMFAANGEVSWFGADLDFVNGLQRTFGTLDKVSAFMDGAKISFGTGQIDCRPVKRESSGSASDPRHNLDFLLS